MFVYHKQNENIYWGGFVLFCFVLFSTANSEMIILRAEFIYLLSEFFVIVVVSKTKRDLSADDEIFLLIELKHILGLVFLEIA